MSDLGSWRNADADPGDDTDEMLRRHRLDDRTADAVLGGRAPQTHGDELVDLAAFVAAVRTEAAGSPARPNLSLAKVLADGISADKGDLPVTAASNVNGPATQVAGPPKRRMRKMLETITTGFAALGLAAKAGIAGATVVATTAGAGAVGVLPDTLQVPFDENLRGIERAEEVLEGEEEPTEPETQRGVVGPDVADEAREDGGVDGPGIADEASDGRSEARNENAEDRPDLPDAAEGRELPDAASGGQLPDEAPLEPGTAPDLPDTPAELPEELPDAPVGSDAAADLPDAPAEPSDDQPVPDEAPPADAPAADAPPADAPATDAPPADAPATDAPPADAPATDAPPDVETRYRP